MNDARHRHASFNTASRLQWEPFAPHRERVTTLLTAGASAQRTRLCVLGAGNGNDLDLSALLAAHREVHLVDLDAEALNHCAARQGAVGRESLRLFGGVDVTAMLDVMGGWSSSVTIPPAVVPAIAEWPAARLAMALPGKYDVVASTCLLSPLISNVVHAAGERHPQFRALVASTRVGHLRLLRQLAKPGGTVILITDVASTDTFPALRSEPDDTLDPIWPELRRRGAYFHGVDPRAILGTLRDDPVLARDLMPPECLPSWRWQLHDRVYLVWALRCRVRPLSSPE